MALYLGGTKIPKVSIGGGSVISAEVVLQDKTVNPTTSTQTVVADSGYDGLSKVTVNAMPTATQATPSITVDGNGLITASATQSAGYVSAGTKIATKQLTTKGATTITPSSAAQVAVSAGTFVIGDIMVAAAAASGGAVMSASGNFTIETAVNTTTVDLSHIGFVPDLFVVYIEDPNLDFAGYATKAWVVMNTPMFQFFDVNSMAVLWRGTKGKYAFYEGDVTKNYITASPVSVTITGQSSSYKLQPTTYYWQALKLW